LIIATLTKPDFKREGYSGRLMNFKKFNKIFLVVIHTIENGNQVVITAHWVAKPKYK